MRIELCNLKEKRGIVVDGDIKYFTNGDIVEVENPTAYINAGIGKEVEATKIKKAKKGK